MGKKHNGNALLLHWNGTTWNKVSPNPSVNKDLEDIYCISSHDCWAVGQNRTFLHWNGNNWQTGNIKTSGNPSSGKVPNKQIYTLHCVNSADCWAGGAQSDNDALLIRWDGNIWQRVLPTDPSVPNKNIYAIHC